MRTVDLIHRKRDGEELSPEEISYPDRRLYRGEIPDYQMSAFLMAVFFPGMTDREVECADGRDDAVRRTCSTFTNPRHQGRQAFHRRRRRQDQPDRRAHRGRRRRRRADDFGRGLGHTGGTLDKLEVDSRLPHRPDDRRIPRAACRSIKLAFIGQTRRDRARRRQAVLAARCDRQPWNRIPLIASSIMSKKLAVGLDALVLDVKVGAGAFMKKQVEARRLAQMMVGIGRRMDKRVQALITDMNQPLGYAIGNALEVMEVSQTLQNAGPADLHAISLELAARMIYLGKITPTLDEAREMAQSEAARRLRLSQVQGSDPGAGRQSAGARPLRTAAERHRRARDSARPRAGYISAIDAEDIGLRFDDDRRGPRHARKTTIDPAVGVILEVKVGQKMDAGRVLCRLYYTSEDRVEEAAQLVEDAFRISASRPMSAN